MGNLITEDWGLVDYAEAWEMLKPARQCVNM